VELTDDGYRSLGDATAFAEREAREAILDVLPAKEENAIKTDELLDKLKEQDIKRTMATGALASLAGSGMACRIGAGKKGNPYRYYRPTPDDEKGSSELWG
jgi:Fe2+ or Zn2+ uptake regulation protein